MSSGQHTIVTGRLVSVSGQSDSLIYGLRDAGSYLYHYTAAPTALKFILKDRTLLLNHITRTNDPRETKTWSFEGHGYSNGSFEAQEKSSLDHEFRRPVHLACFSADGQGLGGDHVEDIHKRGLARPRMWAQYGNRHKGFCLIFDREKITAKARQQFPRLPMYAGRITYRNRSVIPSLEPNAFRIEIPSLTSLGVKEYCNQHRHHYMGQMFFEKMVDWRDEQEWRMAILADSEGPLFIHFEDALVGVVHGAEMKASRSRLAMHLTDGAPVEHIFLKWDNKGPWYDLDHPLNRGALMKRVHFARKPAG